MRRIKFLQATSGFENTEIKRRLDQYEALKCKDFILELEVLQGGSTFLDSGDDFKKTGKVIVEGASKVKPGECHALILLGGIDPALPEARKVSKVPIVGPGEAGMFLARILGSRLSIVTVDEHAVKVAKELVERTGMQRYTVSVRGMGLPVRQLVKDLSKARSVLSEECSKAVHDDGADVIYLGSMSLGTLGITEELRNKLGVPIIDPNEVALRIAELVATFSPETPMRTK